MYNSRKSYYRAVGILSVAISLVLVLVLLAPKVSLADSVTSTVTVGTNPEGVAFDSTNGYIYVANSGSGTVSVIDGSTNAVVANVTVGTSPDKIAFDSTNGHLYVANFGSGTVSVIDGSTNTVVSQCDCGHQPGRSCIRPDQRAPLRG